MKNKKMRKKLMAVTMAAFLAFGGTACGSNRSKGNDSGDSVRKDVESIKKENQVKITQNTTSQEIQSTKRTTYPLTITTYGTDGSELTTIYEKAPEKVVAVYQGCIETMLALGLEEHLVATAGLDNEVPDSQKEAFSKTNYLDEFTPSLETVTMLEPDMIFSWGSLFKEGTLGDTNDWIKKGTNLYMNTNTHPMQNGESYHKTLENEFTDILNIGKIFDVQDRAEAIVNDMKESIAKVQEKTESQKEKPTALILESGKDGFTNYGKTSLGGDMVTKLGGELVNPDASQVGKEDVIAANPDVIFVVYMPYSGDDKEQVKQEKLDVILKDNTYASLDAVKNGRVVPIMLSEMYASATRTKDGIITFAEGLYPEIDLKLR